MADAEMYSLDFIPWLSTFQSLNPLQKKTKIGSGGERESFYKGKQ